MSTDQGSYTSAGNAFNNDLAIDACFNGVYDDMTNYNMVRIWVNTPDEALLRIHYADNSAGDNEQIELFGLYPGNHSSIHNIKKANFARVSLTNTAGITQPGVLLRTKFATRIPHPFLSYTNDNVNVNATVALDEFRVSTFIDHETSDILIYGFDGSTNHPVHTDDQGTIRVKGGKTTNVADDVLLVGGLIDSSNARILHTDNSGNIYSNLLLNNETISSSNPLPVDLSVIEVVQDTPASLKAEAHLVVGDASVNESNPVPTTEVDFMTKVDDLTYVATLLAAGAHTSVAVEPESHGMMSIYAFSLAEPFTIELLNGTQPMLTYPVDLTYRSYCKVPTHLVSRNTFSIRATNVGTGTDKIAVETYFHKDLSEIVLPLGSTGALADSQMIRQSDPEQLQTQAHLMVSDTVVSSTNPVHTSTVDFKVKSDTLSTNLIIPAGSTGSTVTEDVTAYSMIGCHITAGAGGCAVNVLNGSRSVLIFGISGSESAYYRIPTDILHNDFTMQITNTGVGAETYEIDTFLHKELTETIVPRESDGIAVDGRLIRQSNPELLQTRAHLMVDSLAVSDSNAVPVTISNSDPVSVAVDISSMTVYQGTPNELQTEAHLMVDGTAVTLSNPVPVLTDISSVTVYQDTPGDLKVEAHLMVNDAAVTESNPIPIDISTVTVYQDVSASLKTESHLMMQGEPVTLTNPIPVDVAQDTISPHTLYDGLAGTTTVITSGYQLPGSVLSIMGSGTSAYTFLIQCSHDGADWFDVEDVIIAATGTFQRSYRAAWKYIRCQISNGAGPTDSAKIFVTVVPHTAFDVV